MLPARFPLVVPVVALVAGALSGWALVAGCSSSATPQGPDCANESSATPFGDAGVLPLRALPIGRPCATGALCGATIDDCANGWPDGAAVPLTSNATPFQCTCPDGVWSCVATTTAAPVCATFSDAGPIDGGTD